MKSTNKHHHYLIKLLREDKFLSQFRLWFRGDWLIAHRYNYNAYPRGFSYLTLCRTFFAFLIFLILVFFDSKKIKLLLAFLAKRVLTGGRFISVWFLQTIIRCKLSFNIIIYCIIVIRS